MNDVVRRIQSDIIYKFFHLAIQSIMWSLYHYRPNVCRQNKSNKYLWTFETNEMDVILSYQPDFRWKSKKTAYDIGIIMCEIKKYNTIGSNDCMLYIAQYRIMECTGRKKYFSLCRILISNAEFIRISYSLLVTSSNFIYRWFFFDMVSLVYSMYWFLSEKVNKKCISWIRARQKK